MNTSKKINIIFFSLLIVIPFTVFGIMRWINNNYTTLPYYGETQKIKLVNGSEKEAPFIVPSFTFINQDNQPLTSDFVEKKIWVADYFFTSCNSICPKMTMHLQKVNEAFKHDDDVKLISFTVDPDRDTPGALQLYAAKCNATPNQWQFVTGDKKALYAYARKALFIIATDGDGGPGDFIHSENLVLIDAHKHIRGYYDGTSDAEVNQLIKDIKRLQKEK
jgi:protein SCO1